MTDRGVWGPHRHRLVRVRKDGWAHRLLTRPTLRVVPYQKADRSRLVYGPTDDPNFYRLSPLGLLHALTGLTVVTDD